MKKLVSCALVLTMIMGLAGCGSKGGFEATQKKVISAAEDVCGAEEASKKQKKAIKSKEFSPDDSDYSDGVYVTLENSDLSKMDFGNSDFDDETINNVFVFVKSEEGRKDSYIISYLFEMSDKDTAADFYDFCVDQWGTTEKKLKKEAKQYDADYGFDEDDGKLAIIMVSEDKEMAKGVYIKLEGTVVILSIYDGTTDADIYEEMYEFNKKADFVDFEDLLG